MFTKTRESKNNLAIADSGTTGHFITSEAICQNKKKATNGLWVTLLDSSSIQATHSSDLKIAALPMQARKAHVFPQLKTSLISIPQLCDAGYKAIFDDTTVEIVKNNETHLEGHRDKESNLYMIDLDRASKRQKTEKSISQINNVYTKGAKKNFM